MVFPKYFDHGATIFLVKKRCFFTNYVLMFTIVRLLSNLEMLTL